ncbi:MAG: strawberry notch family protein [Patescibacteria group bacterium]|nr:strawberry notch family protein [Patescibacteria group bacterium]
MRAPPEYLSFPNNMQTPVDFDALAAKFGGVDGPPSPTQTDVDQFPAPVDWADAARRNVPDALKGPEAVDFDALAKKYGGVDAPVGHPAVRSAVPVKQVDNGLPLPGSPTATGGGPIKSGLVDNGLPPAGSPLATGGGQIGLSDGQIVLPGSRKGNQYTIFTPPPGGINTQLPAALQTPPVDNGLPVEGSPQATGGGPIYVPPGVPKPPLPEALKSDQQKAAEVPYEINPRTGERFRPPPLGQSFLDFPYNAAVDATRGIEALARPAEAATKEMARLAPLEVGQQPEGPSNVYPGIAKDVARGAHELGAAGFEAATPLMVASGAAAPVETAVALGAGIAAQKATQKAAEHLGIAPEYADLAGDIAAIVAGYAAHGMVMPKEVRALVDVSQGKAGDPGSSEFQDRLSKIRNLANDAGATVGERNAARSAASRLYQKYGFEVPEWARTAETEEAAAPQQAAPQAAATQPAPPGQPPLEDIDATLNPFFPQEQQPPEYNADAFNKQHNAWNDARNKARAQFMKENPGVTPEQADAATAGSYGQEPKIQDFLKPPKPPEPVAQEPEPVPGPQELPTSPDLEPQPEPAEPPKPTPVQRVSPDTPNPPTAYTATEPESPQTIAIQLQQLGEGTRKVVMFPKGQGQPTTFPPGAALTHDDFGNTYVYRPDLIKKSAIHSAARDNRLPEVLGGPMGMGAPDKSALHGEPVTVVSRAADGTEVQSTATDQENLPVTHAATQMVTPPGGTVSVEPAEKVVVERQGQGVPAPAPQPAVPPMDENAYKQAVDLVKANGQASSSLLQRQLRLGYGAASRMLDRMQAEGIIAPPDQQNPGKPRAALPPAPQPEALAAPEPLGGNVVSLPQTAGSKETPLTYGESGTHEFYRDTDGAWFARDRRDPHSLWSKVATGSGLVDQLNGDLSNGKLEPLPTTQAATPRPTPPLKRNGNLIELPQRGQTPVEEFLSPQDIEFLGNHLGVAPHIIAASSADHVNETLAEQEAEGRKHGLEAPEAIGGESKATQAAPSTPEPASGMEAPEPVGGPSQKWANSTYDIANELAAIHRSEGKEATIKRFQEYIDHFKAIGEPMSEYAKRDVISRFQKLVPKAEALGQTPAPAEAIPAPEPIGGAPSTEDLSRRIREHIERGKRLQEQAKSAHGKEYTRLVAAASEEFNKASELSEQKKAATIPSKEDTATGSKVLLADKERLEAIQRTAHNASVGTPENQIFEIERLEKALIAAKEHLEKLPAGQSYRTGLQKAIDDSQAVVDKFRGKAPAPKPVTPQLETGAAGATPLGVSPAPSMTARELASGAKKHGIDASKYEKTPAGRKALAQAIADKDTEKNRKLWDTYAKGTVKTKLLGEIPKPLPGLQTKYLSGPADHSFETAKGLVGSIYQSYGGGYDQILDVAHGQMGTTYKVRDLDTGEIRSHATFVDPREVVRPATGTDKFTKPYNDTGNNGTENAAPAGTNPSGAPAGAVPEGNTAVPVRGSSELRGAEAGNAGAQPNTGGAGEGVRRVEDKDAAISAGTDWGTKYWDSLPARDFAKDAMDYARKATKDPIGQLAVAREFEQSATATRHRLTKEDIEREEAAGSNGTPVRRVTGSADIPLTPAGEKQVEGLAQKAVEPFNAIYYAPNTRSHETATAFAPHVNGPGKELTSLDGWARGEYEGQSAEAVSVQVQRLIMNPDEVPPGVSPASGEPGKSFNQAMKPLFQDVRQVASTMPSGGRTLMVTSGGNMQAVDAWAKAGFPADGEFDRSVIANHPYWSVTGKMFRLGENGLTEVPNDSAPGLYFVEHGSTAWNSNSAASAESAATPAEAELITPAPADSTPIQEVQSEAIPPTLADAPKGEPGHIKLANSVLRTLQNEEEIGNNVAFQRLADKAFGGSRASGAYDMKQAYDALEAAVNRYISDSIGAGLLADDPKYSVQKLRDLMAKLPTQNVRTENQELLQQFSTPPTLSYLAAKAAAIRQVDTVLEPSAGTGSLASWAKAAGAIVKTNEIDPRRAELLSYAVRGSQPTSHDAEFLNSTLPADIKPTVVIMNPPFSATGGRLSANKNAFGYRHVTEALKRLQRGGRLVAILGEGATPSAPNAQPFWKEIAKYGTLRANVGISGKEYAKYGTTFGNRLIVISKLPAADIVSLTGKPVDVITGDFENIEDAYYALRPLIENQPDASVVQPGGPVRGATGETPAVPGERSGGVGTPATGQGITSVPEGGPAEGAETPAREESGPPAERGAPENSASPSGDSGESAVEPVRPEDRISLEARKKEDLLERVEDDSAFVQYVPSIEGLAHPGQLVETKVMASVNPPPVTYSPNLPNTKAPKPLSAAQMETVARAGQMHQQFTEDGQRLGFLLGDGTGVGKGQQIAAIIWDRNRSGQKRAIWVSASKGLQKDARRDFLGIGANDLADKLFGINDWSATDTIDLKDGVLFSTYQSLISKAKGERGQTRLQQVKNWLGKDGVIIFDESQRGKNAVPGDARAVSSKTGGAVVQLQDEIPGAYVVYASATAATDVNNLGYMSRMGLWGKGTPFHQGFGHFMAEIGRGGVAAMELIAREMKALGKYMSRSISYRGVSYEEKIHELTPEQKQTYDAAAKAWQLVFNMSMDQLRENNARDSSALGEFTQRYWGEHQRFFRKLLTAMKVPTVLDIADKALTEGKSVVVSLIGTGQAQADKAMASGAAEDEDDLDFSPKDSLIQLIRDSYPTILYEEYEDEQGNVRKRPVVRDGQIVQNPDAIAKRDDLISDLNRELKLPDSPLDYVVRYYGRDNVSELTGRKKTVERNKQSGKWEIVSRAPEGVPMDKINEYEMDQFQNGKKRVAVISKASGAGFSLHADRTAKNQQPRYHIVMELSWSADDQMQSFGRTHRSNQVQPPEYVIVSTDAGGEKRFSSTIARRLESLGALTKGQRDASGGGSVLAKYNFETRQGEDAANAFYTYLLNDNPTLDEGFTGHDALQQMGILRQRTDAEGNPVGSPFIQREDLTNVTRLMNRVLNVEVDHQNAVFDLFTDLFDQAVQRAIENGTLDTGVNLIRGDHITLIQAKPIAKDPQSGAETYRYAVQAERKNRPVPVSTIKQLSDKGRGQMMKRREFKGTAEPNQLIWAERSRTPITNRNGTVENAYNYFGPEHRESPTSYDRMSESDMRTFWEPIEGADNLDKAQKLTNWVKEYEESVKKEKLKKANGQYNSLEYYERTLKEYKDDKKKVLDAIRKAKEGQFDLWQEALGSAPASRKERIDMIGGSVLRVWPLLKVGNGRMDIRIAYPDSGGSITGVAMTEGDANAVEQQLTGQTVSRGPSSIFDAAIRGKEVFNLAGGVRLSQGRVNREPVIEITSNDYNNEKFLDQAGVSKEKIGWKYKRYIPNNPTLGVPILEKILKQFPVNEQGRPVGQNQPFGSERGSITLGPLVDATDAVTKLAKDLYTKDITPATKKATAKLRAAMDDFQKAFAPQTRGPQARYGYNLIRESNAEIDHRRDIAHAAMIALRKHFMSMPVEYGRGVTDNPNPDKDWSGFHGLSVWDDIETGRVMGLTGADREFADTARRLIDQRTAELAELGLLKTYVDNYLGREWKEPEQASRWAQNWQAKRPMAGKENYRKQRTYPTMLSGIEDPDFTLVPKYDNPVDQLLSKLGEMDRSIIAHKMVRELERHDDWHYFPGAGPNTPPPAGMGWIDDKIAYAYGPKKGAVSIDTLKQEPKPQRTDFGLGPGRYDFQPGVDDPHRWRDYQEALRDWRDTNVLPEDVTVHGHRIMGRYAAPEPLARVINNYLSVGIGNTTAYQAWREINNGANLLELSGSWYHGLTTTLNASFSDIALGLRQLVEGRSPADAVKGLGSIGSGLVPFASVVQDAFPYIGAFGGKGEGYGTKLQYAWDHWNPEMGDGKVAVRTPQGKTVYVDNPLTWTIIDTLKAGGGAARQDSYYAVHFADRFMDALRQIASGPDAHDKVTAGAKMLLNALPAGMEKLMDPIMKYLVPRAKLAAFAKRMEWELQYNPNMNREELRDAAGKIWDSMDNRFGQFRQKNLLMSAFAREAVNGIIGRPGWNLGSLLEIGGGVVDLGKTAVDAAKLGASKAGFGPPPRKPVRFSDRTYYTFGGMLIGTVILNGVLNWLFTGDLPGQGKDGNGWDFVAFRDGGVTEDGNPSRQILPAYLSKDIISFAEHPVSTIRAKAVPVISISSDLLSNHDYNRHKIFGEGGIGWRRYMLDALTPYSLKGIEKLLDRGNSLGRSLIPEVGVLPASREIGLTKAQQIVANWEIEQRSDTKPPSDQHSRAVSQISIAAKHGDMKKARELGRQAVDNGIMRYQDVQKAIARGQSPPLLAGYKSISNTSNYGFSTAMHAYDVATPAEKVVLKREAMAKARQAQSRPWLWNKEDGSPDARTRAIALKYFNVRPFTPYNAHPLGEPAAIGQ